MKYKHYFPAEVVEHVFHYLTCNEDRNSVSLVCKSWYNIERLSRNKVLVLNVYFINPDKVMARFPNLKSLTLKGKRDSYVFTTRPPYWSASLHPWIEALVSARVELEELRLKRIVVSDKTLRLITKSFANFKSLSLVSCQGFTTDGLAAIASKCRFLRELDLQNNEIDDPRGQWLSCFPDSCTTLVSLDFAWLSGQVNVEALERLVARCRNLKSLRVNRTVRLDALQKILVQAPQLVDLGVGTFLGFVESYSKLKIALRKCSSIRSFSGFLFAAAHRFLPAIYPICQRLTSLNLSHSPIEDSSYLMELIRHCLKLECLWIRDSIGDEGLRIVSSTCKELQELRIFPERYFGVTEEGLVAVSAGCPKLKSLQYMCQQMTNVALITVAKNCPNLVRFKLFLGNPKGPDAITMQPLDEGFGAIVQSCKGLKQLKLSGLLTDQVFLYIGMYAEQLQKLTIPFAGDSDKGMLYVLNGCKNLKELNIRNSFFENVELLVDVGKYEMMRSLCMFSCQVTLGACKALARKRPRLNVEIITPDDNKDEIEKMYVYHTVVGPSKDLLDSVQTL